MIRDKRALLLIVAALVMGGCDNTSTSDSTSGPSSVVGQQAPGEIGSQSLTEDIGAHLEKNSWKSIELDLDAYLYATKGSVKSYTMQMDFKDATVTALADCYVVTAKYRVKEDELSFSRVSAPKPDIDNPTCSEFEDAESAVSAFFTSDYIVNSSSENTLTLEATDVEATVTLKR